MKKIFTILAILILAAFSVLMTSCTKMFRDELNEIHSQMDKVLELVDQANSNLEAVQALLEALEKKDYITSITPIIEDGVEIGYIIRFSQSESITIYHGFASQISVRQDTDGQWYWTVDGEWMLDDNGQKVRAIGQNGEEGVTPELKIEDDRWLVSYDGGKTWSDLGKSTGNGGDSIFKEIIITDGEVIFRMADGSEFAIPKNTRVKLILDIKDKETGVLPGSEIQINYTLENATDSTFVTASSNGYYGVRVEAFDHSHGRIIVTSPNKYVDGYINVMVSDGASYSFIKVINFYEHKMVFPEGMEYNVSPHGGEINIPFSTNFQYRFEVDGASEDWISISYYETRSEMSEGILKVTVAMNDNEHARMGKIRVIPTNSTGDMYAEIIINQASAYFSIDQSKYAVPVEGGSYTTHITSTRGLKLHIPSDAAGWLAASVKDHGGDVYTVTTTISENESPSKRSASVGLYSKNGDIYLGALEFVQSSPVEEEISDMIFIVRANWSNDFTAILPIAGYYDCYIDWGDGQAEHVNGGDQWNQHQNAGIFHVYDIQTPTSYTVRITGTVSSLSSYDIKAPCITEVVQWGKTGLKNINYAFYGNYLLEKVCSDPYGGLSDITTLTHMFYGCLGLKNIPEGIFESCKNVTSANYTFQNCHALEYIPENLFASCSLMQSMYDTFDNCSSLTDIPEKLFACNTELEEINGVFSRCTNISQIPEDLFINNTKIGSFAALFRECSNLTSIPEGLFRNNIYASSFQSTFYFCYSLEKIPTGLFDNNRKVTDFSLAFYCCDRISGESPYSIIDGVKYHLYERHLNPDHFVRPASFDDCFWGCDNLIDWEEIDEPWK